MLLGFGLLLAELLSQAGQHGRQVGLGEFFISCLLLACIELAFYLLIYGLYISNRCQEKLWRSLEKGMLKRMAIEAKPKPITPAVDQCVIQMENSREASPDQQAVQHAFQSRLESPSKEEAKVVHLKICIVLRESGQTLGSTI